jgi:hypothetical protein
MAEQQPAGFSDFERVEILLHEYDRCFRPSRGEDIKRAAAQLRSIEQHVNDLTGEDLLTWEDGQKNCAANPRNKVRQRLSYVSSVTEPEPMS